MAVDRCLCYDVTFKELQALAREKSLDYAGLSRTTGCGTGCGLCMPYVQLMLASGQTVFPVLSPKDIEQMLREATTK